MAKVTQGQDSPEESGGRKKRRVRGKARAEKKSGRKRIRGARRSSMKASSGDSFTTNDVDAVELHSSREPVPVPTEPDASGFDVGIFDAEPSNEPANVSVEAESHSSPRSAGTASNGPKPPVASDTSAATSTRRPASKTGRGAGSSGKKAVRRSRTHRLAEEAEVIAALAKKSSDGEHPGKDALNDREVKSKTKERSADTRRRKKRAKSGPEGDRVSTSRRGRRGRGKKTSNLQVSAFDVPAADGSPDRLDFDEIESESTTERIPDANERAEPAIPAGLPADLKISSPKARPAAARKKAERREMLINVADTDECRIALLSDGRLSELLIERAASSTHVGDIYKGRVTNVEPSIQAAFIDFGVPAQGFLHISDLHPRFFPDSRGEPEVVGKKTPRRQRPLIQNCLKRGQEVIVQVIKEGIGTKGPTLSGYVSLPGRFLVMMPEMEQHGVSRKIEDEEKRRKMRELLGQLSLPKGMGFIVRTAGVDRTKRDLQRDLNYLARLWKKVEKRIRDEAAPAELYRESDLVIRTIRDVFDSSLERIVVDSPSVATRVREFLAIASPRSQDLVRVYDGVEPLFHRYGIEVEIDRLHSKTVPLPCGGSLVIEQTEAMVAVDVNSGRFRVPENAEETAYQVNLEAVDEIARQLRLRDLGGLIVCDLIDMENDRHRRTVERRLADALRKHKERASILRISQFGILEMTRQRQRPSLTGSMFMECPRCLGSGHVKAPESVGLEVMRKIRLASHREGVARIDVRVSTAVANVLLNRKRLLLSDLERQRGLAIQIHGVDSYGVGQVTISCSDRRGRDVQPFETKVRSKMGAAAPSPARSRRRGGRRGK